MRKLILIFALIPLMAFAQYGQRGAGGGSTFYWSLTGQAQKTDSLRIIQGTNMTITQSGNTVTFNGAAGAGSTANVRANTGWTSDGTTAQDTLALAYLLNKANIRFMVVDADGDTLWFWPQSLHPFVLKDGTSLLSGIDSTGRGYFGGNAATAGQTNRAFLNVVGIGDTLAAFIGDGNRAPGDSTTQINANGSLKVQGNLNISYGGGYLSIGSDAAGANGVAILQGASDALYLGAKLGYGITFRSNATRIGSFSSTGLFSAGGNYNAQAAMQIRQAATADTLFMARNDKNATLDSTAMVFADGSHQFGVTAGGTNAFSGTAEHDTVTVTGASVNDIYTVTIKGAAAPAAADFFAVEALATGFAVHRSAAGTSGLEYYWRRERR